MATIIIPLFGEDDDAPVKRDEEAEKRAAEQLEQLQKYWREVIEKQQPQVVPIPITEK